MGSHVQIVQIRLHYALHHFMGRNFEPIMPNLHHAGHDIMMRHERWLDPAFWEKISVERLCQHMAKGADIGAKDESGKTPLHFAADQGNVCAVRALVEAGADVNAHANNKVTPLHLAAKRRDVDLLRALLEAGADPNAINKRGLTPLFHAAIWGTPETVGLLIASGSDAGIRDHAGLMPLAYASLSVRKMLDTEEGKVEGTSCLAKDGKNIMLYWDDPLPPPDVSNVFEQWQTHCPDWKVCLFDQNKAFRFIRDNVGEYIATLFLTCALPSMRSDFFRVFWGVVEGGIYSDITFVPRREPLFFDIQKNLTVARRRHGNIESGIFFAKKNCKELRLIAYEIIKSVGQRKEGSIITVTGPVVWRKAIWQRETCTMAIVDFDDMWHYIERSNYPSSTRGTSKHWTRLQWQTGIYREPPEFIGDAPGF